MSSKRSSALFLYKNYVSLFNRPSQAARSGFHTCPRAVASGVTSRIDITMPSTPAKLKAILFDLDGTCVNSDNIHFETYRETILDLAPEYNNGIPITREQYDTKMAGHQNPELVASILPNLPLAERTKLWQAKERRYENVIRKGVPPITGLISLLKECQQNDIVHYVVTNAPKRSCTLTLSSIGIAPFFQARVVVAEECEKAKPHPHPYLRALELAGVQAGDAIAFEDSPSGTTSATAAGLYTIGIRSTQSDEALRSAGAAFTIADYTDASLRDFLAGYMQLGNQSPK